MHPAHNTEKKGLRCIIERLLKPVTEIHLYQRGTANKIYQGFTGTFVHLRTAQLRPLRSFSLAAPLHRVPPPQKVHPPPPAHSWLSEPAPSPNTCLTLLIPNRQRKRKWKHHFIFVNCLKYKTGEQTNRTTLMILWSFLLK